jgi:integrase
MARSAKLKVVYVKSRNRYRVEVPRSLSDTGARRQLFFETKAAAIGAIELLKTKKHNLGVLASALSAPQIAEASQAFKILEPYGIGLLDAIRSHIALVKARSSSVTLGQAFDRYAESRQTRTPKYLREIQYARTTFGPLLDSMICDITASDLEPILDPLPGPTRNAKMRRANSVFNFATRRGWMGGSSNPISSIDFAPETRKEVEIFPVETVQKLLNCTLENDLEFLPVYIFTFFTGTRSDGEIARVLWSDVRIAERTLVLRAAITKIKRRRIVPLSDNAVAWLSEFQARGGNMTTGLVAPWPPHVRHARHRSNYRAIGLKRWIQSGARHSFASYWLGLNQDIDRLCLLTGHSDPDVMFERYHAGVASGEAAKYWSIMPPAAAVPNLVAFA